MKSFLKSLPMLAMLVGASVFAACSDDDDENGGGSSGNVGTPMVIYGLQPSADMMAVANVVVTYWNADGKQVRDTLTETPWQMTFTLTKSQQVGYAVTVTAKENLDELLTKDHYVMSCGYTYIAQVRKEEGGNAQYYGTTESGSKLPVGSDKVAEYLRGNSNNRTYSASYDKATNSFTDWQITIQQ